MSAVVELVLQPVALAVTFTVSMFVIVIVVLRNQQNRQQRINTAILSAMCGGGVFLLNHVVRYFMDAGWQWPFGSSNATNANATTTLNGTLLSANNISSSGVADDGANNNVVPIGPSPAELYDFIAWKEKEYFASELYQKHLSMVGMMENNNNATLLSNNSSTDSNTSSNTNATDAAAEFADFADLDRWFMHSHGYGVTVLGIVLGYAAVRACVRACVRLCSFGISTDVSSCWQVPLCFFLIFLLCSSSFTTTRFLHHE